MAAANPDAIACVAIAFAKSRETFTPRQFVDFLDTLGERRMDEEAADEFLSDMVDRNQMRQIGPGVYAKAKQGD